MTMKNKKIVITAIVVTAIMTFSMTSAAFGTGIMMPLSGWCEPVTELGYQVVDAWFYVCDNIDPRLTALESVTVVNGTDGINGVNGTTGPQGPQGTYEHLNFYTVNVTEDNAGGDKIVIAYCNSGDIVTGGGFGVKRTNSTSLYYFNPTITEPLSDLSGWKSEWAGGTVSGYDFTSYVVCMDKTP